MTLVTAHHIVRKSPEDREDGIVRRCVDANERATAGMRFASCSPKEIAAGTRSEFIMQSRHLEIPMAG
jgi:hypothetical protein